MNRLYNKECNLKDINTPSLAFIGDCVFELFVRESIITNKISSAENLHNASIRQVCCSAQAKFAKVILPVLTEKELNIYKRGRNLNTNHTPKNASVSDYHSATGLEVLFGYLYLNDEIERLRYLFDYCQN